MHDRNIRQSFLIADFWGPGSDLELQPRQNPICYIGQLPGVAAGNDIRKTVGATLTRSAAYEWSHERVCEHFRGLKDDALLAIVQKELLDGRALENVSAHLKHLQRRLPDVPLGVWSRFEAEAERLCAFDDAIITLLVPRLLRQATAGRAGVDEIAWFKHVQENTILSKVVWLSDYGLENVARRQVEFRYARIVGVTKGVEDTIGVAFRAATVVLHHVSGVVEKDPFTGVSSCAVQSHYLRRGQPQMRSFSFDLLAFEWKPHLHPITPHCHRLALIQLMLIRRFCPSHTLARFDKHLLYHLFSFLVADVVSPVSLGSDAAMYVAQTARANYWLKHLPLPQFSDKETDRPSFLNAGLAALPGVQLQFHSGINTYDIGGMTIKFGE